MGADLRKVHEKHGCPLHVSILSHKFDVALRMLRLGPLVVDPHMLTTTVQANILHLLFVKFDKDEETATEILSECVKLGVNVNHVDSLEAAPIHLALRKR